MQIEKMLQECIELSQKKRADYTSGSDRHENFKRAAEIASWFKKDEHKPYAILIGTKIARLASLLSTDREPNNESILDTFKDLINYSGLFGEFVTENVIDNDRITNDIKLQQLTDDIEWRHAWHNKLGRGLNETEGKFYQRIEQQLSNLNLFNGRCTICFGYLEKDKEIVIGFNERYAHPGCYNSLTPENQKVFMHG